MGVMIPPPNQFSRPVEEAMRSKVLESAAADGFGVVIVDSGRGRIPDFLIRDLMPGRAPFRRGCYASASRGPYVPGRHRRNLAWFGARACS
jgi:hypothetical protein